MRKQSAECSGFTYKEVLELSRVCVNPKYQKKNLLTWALTRIFKNLKVNRPEIKAIISFADTGQNHTGAVYKAANFKLEREVEPSYHYVSKNNHVMHKKTLWDHARSLRMTEIEFANKYEYKRVDGFKKLKFIYKLSGN
jgi:hypothetical protein